MSSSAISTYVLPNPWEFISEQVQITSDESAFSSILSPELILNIFSYLPPKDLARAGRVSKDWKEFTSDPLLWKAFDVKKLFPNLSIFDEKAWPIYFNLTEFGLSVEDTPKADYRFDIPVLYTLFKSNRIRPSGLTILTIPEGLSLCKLEKMASSLQFGNPTKIDFIAPIIRNLYGDITVKRTYRVILTNDILEGTLGFEEMDAKKKIVEEEVKCELPGFLAVATLCIVSYISSPKQTPTSLYGKKTYTDCSEQIDNDVVAVGGFGQAGLAICSHAYDFESHGAGAQKILDSNEDL